MKSKKLKPLYLITSLIGLIFLVMLIFILNEPNQESKHSINPTYHQDENTFPKYKPHQSREGNLANEQSKNIKEQQQELEKQLSQMQAGYATLAAEVSQEAKIIGPPIKRTFITPITSQKSIKPLTPMEKQASHSAVFFQGSAPRPIRSKLSPNNLLIKNSSSSQSGSNQDNQESDNNDKSNSNINSINNNGAYGNNRNNYPFIPVNPTTNMTMQYTPSNTYSFVYDQSTAATKNPLDKISSSLTLTLAINNPKAAYTTIKFCNSQYASCLSLISLSSASFTITTRNVTSIKPTITGSSYSSSTINGTTTSYMLPSLYFLLGTSNTSTSTKASAQFPANSCVADTVAKTATCTITNSYTATVNISVYGTTTN